MTLNNSRLRVRHIYGEDEQPTTYTICRQTGRESEDVEGPFAEYSEANQRLAELRVKAATELPNSKKRKRTVFPTSEIPHLWMHKAVPEARSGGNVFFEGDTIYSYGRHFPIARHVANEAGDKAVLFTTRNYSVTTSGHKNAVRSAIPESVTVFTVSSITGRWDNETDHAANIVDYQKRVRLLCEQSARARTRRDWLLNEAIELREQAIKYAAFFGVEATFEEIPADLDELKKRLAEQARAEAAKRAKREAERVERERIEQAENIEKFRNGGNFRTMYYLPPMLRVVGDEVETSRGARFPVKHAKRGLKLIQAVIASGEEWKSNGHTCHLGRYQIDRIEKDGTVHAGCHVVAYEEIQRITPDLEAYVEKETEEKAS